MISPASKIVSREEAVAAREEARLAGKIVGFTSGVFDLVHPGHVDYLFRARELCDLLIVGVNATSSVRSNKGPQRPICEEDDRAFVVAGLESVDRVFLFDELNNNRNVEVLRPDIYIKAGDYDRSKLSSASLVERSGGKVVILPMRGEHSSTRIIERAARIYGDPGTETKGEPRPAAFLDRDGTIIKHVHYLHEPEKLELIPGALEAMKRLKERGLLLVIVTNQPGIGLGYFTREDFFRVNTRLLARASKEGVYIDKIYYCPHNESEGCDCRKPKTGMIEKACRDLPIDISRSFMVGDMPGDVLAGKAAGCRTVLVGGGNDGGSAPEFSVPSMVEAAEVILRELS